MYDVSSFTYQFTGIILGNFIIIKRIRISIIHHAIH